MTPAPARLGRMVRARWRLIGSILGLALLVAAVWAAAADPEAWRAVAGARTDWRLWSLALLLPALNWLVVSLSFWPLLRRYGRIDASETAALIGSAWLLNYLPMRPGLVGRVAYHKVVNGISVHAAAFVTIIGMVASGVGSLILLAIAVGLGPGASGAAWAISLVIPLVALSAIAGGLWARGYEAWPIGLALALRYVDVLIWAGRYAVTFALVGAPISADKAIALAIVSQIAMLVPIAGNGLGLREWAIGLTAASLAGAGAEAGLAADLVNRAVEVAVAIPVGLVSAKVVSRRLARALEEREKVGKEGKKGKEGAEGAGAPPGEPGEPGEPPEDRIGAGS